MTKSEEIRQKLEKFVPKRVIDQMEKSIEEVNIASKFLKEIKPYKVLYQREIEGKGGVYTAADMIKMFRFGLHLNEEKKPESERHEPLYKSGDVLKETGNPDHIIFIKGYKGEHYKVREKGEHKFLYYSMDYVETNFERYDINR